MAKRFSNLNSAKKAKIVDLLAPALGYFVPPPGFGVLESKPDFVARYYDEQIVRDYLFHKSNQKADEARKIESHEDSI